MRRARASAGLRDEHGFRTALDQARRHLGAASAHERPPWSYWLTDDVLLGEEGRGWVDLGAPDRGRTALTCTVVSGDTSGRDRVLYGAALAEADLADGAVDQACSEVEEVLPFLTATSSHRCREVLLRVARGLSSSRLAHDQRRVVTTLEAAIRSRPGI
jgi:hypothetical protein